MYFKKYLYKTKFLRRCLPIGMAVVVVVTDDSAADNEVVEGEGMVIPVNIESLDE